jgi:hypothetical protein
MVSKGLKPSQEKKWTDELQGKSRQYDDIATHYNDLKTVYKTDPNVFKVAKTSAKYANNILSHAMALPLEELYEQLKTDKKLPGLIVSTRMFNIAEALRHGQVCIYRYQC